VAEIIELNELATRRQALEQQRQALANCLSELEQLAHQQVRQEALTADVIEFCENIDLVLQLPTPGVKQQGLCLFHILVEKEQLIIKHVIPLSGDRRLHTQRSSNRNLQYCSCADNWLLYACFVATLNTMNGNF